MVEILIIGVTRRKTFPAAGQKSYPVELVERDISTFSPPSIDTMPYFPQLLVIVDVVLCALDITKLVKNLTYNAELILKQIFMKWPDSFILSFPVKDSLYSTYHVVFYFVSCVLRHDSGCSERGGSEVESIFVFLRLLLRL